MSGRPPAPASAAELRLAAGLRAGDPDALAALHATYGRTVFGFLRGALRDRGTAEDVFQVVFTEVWRRGASYDPERAGLLTWIMTIARSGRSTSCAAACPSPTRTPWRPGRRRGPRGGGRRARRALARGAPAHAPAPDEAEALRLRFYAELSQTEIAERTGTPLGTVKTRMVRGLERLRDLLEAEDARTDGAIARAGGASAPRTGGGRVSPWEVDPIAVAAGELSAPERAEADRLLREDPAFRVEVERVARVTGALPPCPPRRGPRAPRRPRRSTSRPPWPRGPAAAEPTAPASAPAPAPRPVRPARRATPRASRPTGAGAGVAPSAAGAPRAPAARRGSSSCPLSAALAGLALLAAGAGGAALAGAGGDAAPGTVAQEPPVPPPARVVALEPLAPVAAAASAPASPCPPARAARCASRSTGSRRCLAGSTWSSGSCATARTWCRSDLPGRSRRAGAGDAAARGGSGRRALRRRLRGARRRGPTHSRRSVLRSAALS
jgi:RNA polymerase sigma-70 factor (ECF subfamily)